MLPSTNEFAHKVYRSKTAGKSTEKPRKLTKRRQQRLGYLLFDGQRSSVPCGVHNFSTNGAALAVSGWMGLPDTFLLYVEPDCIRVTCRVVAKKGSTVRVEFTEWEEAGSSRMR